MDDESLNLCKRLESNMVSLQRNLDAIQSNMNAVLHLLRGNELDDESGMISQLKGIKMDLLLNTKREAETRKEMFDKMSSDKHVLENKIEMMRMAFDTRLVKVEKWKDKVIWMAVGIGIGGGFGLKSLIDYLSKHQ